MTISNEVFSRNYGCRPGHNFRDEIDLPGWEEQSVWGYDTAMDSFFAQLYLNGNTSETPEIYLSGFHTIYPWPGAIALEIMERLNQKPLTVVRALGIADPHPTLRPHGEIEQRLNELVGTGSPSRYDAGLIRALAWVHGSAARTPGSLRRWANGIERPTSTQGDAEHHIVTGRVYRGQDRYLYSGADEALWWALGRDSHRVPPSPAPNSITVTSPQHNTSDRVWLDVPFDEKNDAKALGARWDEPDERWYAPPGAPPALIVRWPAQPDVPDLLPGEDRSLGSGLFVDLIPSTCWFTNVRYCVIPLDWERLRRMITRRAGKRCEVCGQTKDRSAGRRLEAHERWAYDDQTSVQTLRRLICLCTPCHTVTHFGLTTIKGKAQEAYEHLRAVTGMTDPQAQAHIADAFALWERRSARTWTLDLSMLTSAGVTLASPPQASDRARIAGQTLRDLHNR
jgi:hypothetical protein